jgi:hypothetical protein
VKSIEEHFIDSMPADIAAMAIRNTSEDLLDLKICKTPAAALQRAFWWADTNQRSAFWASVFLTISKEGDFRDMRIEQLEQDRKRLDWLLRDATFLTGINSREKIDEAMDEEWFERERHDKIMSGMDAEDYE